MRVQIDDPFYTIVVDAGLRLTDVTPRGLWDHAVAARFLKDQVAALEILPRHGCPPGEQVTLVDLTQFIVQQGDLAETIAMMPRHPALATRRLAAVVPAPLLRMQVKRLAPEFPLFDTRAAALDWLMAEDNPPHSP